MTNEKLKQKLCDLVMQHSDADPGDYSSIYDAVEDLFQDRKIPAKNLGQKSTLKGIAWDYVDDIFNAIENRFQFENRDLTDEESDELNDIIEHLVSFILKFYNN